MQDCNYGTLLLSKAYQLCEYLCGLGLNRGKVCL